MKIINKYISNCDGNYGVFWGKFDPPTRAHREIIMQSCSILQLSKIFIIVNNFQNNYRYAALQRKIMMEAICNSLCDLLPHVTFEILIQDNINYIDYFSLKAQCNNKKLSVICGYDSFALWSIKDINLYDKILVFARNGNVDCMENNIIIGSLGDDLESISSKKAKNELDQKGKSSMVPDEINDLL